MSVQLQPNRKLESSLHHVVTYALCLGHCMRDSIMPVTSSSSRCWPELKMSAASNKESSPYDSSKLIAFAALQAQKLNRTSRSDTGIIRGSEVDDEASDLGDSEAGKQVQVSSDLSELLGVPLDALADLRENRRLVLLVELSGCLNLVVLEFLDSKNGAESL